MAKIYRAFDKAPRFNPDESYGEYREREVAYLDAQAKKCKERHPHDEFAGEQVQWSVADGYARYMVLKSKPLSLIHLELGDAYRLQPYAERGLQLRDIRKSVDLRKHWDQLLAKRAG